MNHRKLCPLSFGFTMPDGPPIAIRLGETRQSLKVGLPCAGDKCMWWSETIEDCKIEEILQTVNALIPLK